MTPPGRPSTRLQRRFGTAVALAACVGGATPASAQLQGLEKGEWHYLGGDAGHTRSNPDLTQIDAFNFSDLEVAWLFRGDNFGPIAEFTARSTPTYADGILYTVFGGRRQVVAIDPATGEVLWTFREPQTMRYRRSPRADFGTADRRGRTPWPKASPWRRASTTWDSLA